MPTYTNDATHPLVAQDLQGTLVTVPAGGTIQTYHRLTESGWAKTSEEPYYNIAEDTHTVVAAAAGWEDQAVNPENEVLEVRTDVDVVIHANDQLAEGYPLPALGRAVLSHGGTIEKLCLDFSAAGTVTILEIKE